MAGAPAIDIEAVFRLDLAARMVRFSIEHDGFLAYEAYVSTKDGSVIELYTYDPRPAGQDIMALFPPMDRRGGRNSSF